MISLNGLGSLLPDRPPKVIVGALRPKMLEVAFTHVDGAIVNILGPDDPGPVIDAVGPQRYGRDGRGGIELIVKAFVCPTEDVTFARRSGRQFLGCILTVDLVAHPDEVVDLLGALDPRQGSEVDLS